MSKLTDLTYLNEVTNGDNETKKQLIAMFFSQMQQTSIDLQNALKDNDLNLLSKTAHTAKSSLKVMGINSIAEKMENLQNFAAKGENQNQYKYLVDMFLQNITAAISELKEEMEKL